MKYLRHLIYLFSFLYSPLIYLLIKSFVLIKTIRITPIMTNRYGHFASNPEYYLLEKKNCEKKNKYLDIFFSSRLGICNSVLLNLWKKKILIIPYYWVESTYKLFIKLEKQNTLHTIPNFSLKTRFFNYNYNNYKPSIFLNDNQKKYCKEILKEQNIDIENIKFVCLFNRDHAYHNSFKHKKNWYYLSHHNYKINSFELTARRLSSNNIVVFRMGTKVEEEFNLNDPNIIDYANSEIRSELMDIFLASNCFFGISCGTGSSHIAILNRKPIVDLNANLHHLFTFLNNAILLSKHYFSIDKNRYLNLEEILSYKEHEIRKREQLDKNRIEMIDCTPEEIADAVDEMLLRLNRKWEDNNQIIELQNRFKKHNWSNIIRESNGIKMNLHGEINARYSSNFLLRNKNWVN